MPVRIKKMFLDVAAACEFTGMSEKQFVRAVEMTGIKPFTVPGVLHSTKQFWTRQQLEDNMAMLRAARGSRGKPKRQGPRVPGTRKVTQK